MDNSSQTAKSKASFKHFERDKLPKILFWDTSFPLSAIISPKQSYQKKAVVDFIERLVKERVTIAFSSTLFTEFINVSFRNEMIKAFGTKFDIKKAIAKNIQVITPHIPDIHKNSKVLHDLLSKFDKGFIRIINPVEPGIILKALELRTKYKLDQADSIHIATMLFSKQKDIACFDKKDFGRVDGLNLWCKFSIKD